MTRAEVRPIVYPAGVSTENSSEGPSASQGSEAGVRKRVVIGDQPGAKLRTTTIGRAFS